MKDKPFVGNVLDNPKYKDKVSIGEASGAFDTALETGAHVDPMVRFHGRHGHGFAAEQANNAIDILHGKDAIIVGNDYAKNGADRLVNGQEIQTKYCQNALATVDAAFENGQYRYVNKVTNKLMQLEVPKDQYDKAVEIMRKRIEEGKFKKYDITDPKDAEKLVRKGSIDYKTACNIAKPANIDSLKFDAANGAVVATSAFGISALISYAKAVWDGEPMDKAIDIAMYSGLKMGGIAFASSVISSQLIRTSVNSALLEPSILFVQALPSNVRHALVNSMRDGALIYGGAASNNLAKLVRCNIISGAAVILVMSAQDISDCFNGRISAKQLLKNIATLAGGLVSGYGCAAVGGVLFGPPGAVAGGLLGGGAGGTATNKLSDIIIGEDDAVEMLRIINKQLIPLAQSYLLSELELKNVIYNLQAELEKEELKNMYASTDKEKFADELLMKIIDGVVKGRAHIYLPLPEEIQNGMERVLELCGDKSALDAHFKAIQINAVDVGTKLLGKELSERAAHSALLATQRMNTVNIQKEILLQNMSVNERKTAKRISNDEMIASLDAIDKKYDEFLKE